jgi:hypothetical protein
LSHVLVTVDGVWIGDGASCTYGQYMHTVAWVYYGQVCL